MVHREAQFGVAARREHQMEAQLMRQQRDQVWCVACVGCMGYGGGINIHAAQNKQDVVAMRSMFITQQCCLWHHNKYVNRLCFKRAMCNVAANENINT